MSKNILTDEECQKLGQGLRKIQTQKENSIWYQGNERYFDIFISLNGDKIDWLQITFRGEFVEWKNGKLKHGKTNEFSVQIDQHPASKILESYSGDNAQLIKNLIQIISVQKQDQILQKTVLLLTLSN